MVHDRDWLYTLYVRVVLEAKYQKFCSQVKFFQAFPQNGLSFNSRKIYGEGEGVLQIAKVRLEERYSLITDPRSQALNLLFGL